MFKVGDFVKTSRYGYEGRVIEVSKLSSSDMSWVRSQAIPYTSEDKAADQISILVNGGGSITAPATSCTPVVIDGFSHPYHDQYFPS